MNSKEALEESKLHKLSSNYQEAPTSYHFQEMCREDGIPEQDAETYWNWQEFKFGEPTFE